MPFGLVYRQHTEGRLHLPAHLRHVDPELAQDRGVVTRDGTSFLGEARDPRPCGGQVQSALGEHRRGPVRGVREHA